MDGRKAKKWKRWILRNIKGLQKMQRKKEEQRSRWRKSIDGNSCRPKRITRAINSVIEKKQRNMEKRKELESGEGKVGEVRPRAFCVERRSLAISAKKR